MIGSTLAHYTVDELLGRGGMGAVYRARDAQLDRTVAIKVLADTTGDARRQLLREARAASALTHPSIVTIHAIEQQDATDFIVMEYVQGRPLGELIPAGGLPIRTALDYATQIAGALAAAHAAGVVHRDIKPANVMVTSSGTVKVLDFGIARRVTLDENAVTRLAPTVGTVAPQGAVIGTIGYMSPEQIAGRPATPASDVFAFGVLLFQMLVGRPPFAGDTTWAVMDATVHAAVPSVTSLVRDVPPALGSIVQRCLEKEPGERFQNGAEVLDALTRASGPEPPPAASRRTTAVVVVAAVVLAAAGGAALWRTNARERRAADVRTTVAEVARLASGGEQFAGFALARKALEKYPGDPDLDRALRSVSNPIPVNSDPPGANVAVTGYDTPDSGWITLGTTPLPAGTRVPFGQLRWRISKPGFETVDASPNNPQDYRFTLPAAGSVPDGMVFVPSGDFQLERTNADLTLPGFWIDRYEVTNRDFKKFVDAGGYRRREWWREPIVENGRELGWEAGVDRFRDTTGRPGPSTWELGTYPEGQDDFPVSGISWYEAAAYAAFAGKSLPTVYHWYRASGAFGIWSDILTRSNFNGKGTVKVGSLRGIGPFGTYDMAGNVKEWCWNQAAPGKRFVLGGAFNDANYQFRDEDARLSLERSPGFGVRLVKYANGVDAELLEPVVSVETDPSLLKPVDDQVFTAFKRFYDYDPLPLDTRIESEDTSNPAYTRQRVSFTAAYNNERVPAEVFVPKGARPPFQAIVYYPGSDSNQARSSRDMSLAFLEFLARSGRLVIFPVYQNTFERHLDTRPSGQNGIRQMQLQRAQDLRRAVDYLESRPDVDRGKIAGYGLSLGAQLMPVFLVVEPRLKAGVLLSGGFETWTIPPEVDPVNFAPRVRQPVLMVNGREDFDLPYETAQVPLFRMLGTADKEHVVLEGGHIPPRPQLVFKTILDWLDKRFGAPQ